MGMITERCNECCDGSQGSHDTVLRGTHDYFIVGFRKQNSWGSLYLGFSGSLHTTRRMLYITIRSIFMRFFRCHSELKKSTTVTKVHQTCAFTPFPRF